MSRAATIPSKNDLPHMMRAAPLLPADTDAARAVFSGAPFTTLLPRPSSIPPDGGNEHAGHCANDPIMFGLLGLPLVSEELPRDGLLTMRRGDPGSPLAGVVSVRCAAEVATIDCLALGVATLGEMMTVDEALDATVAACIEHARGAGCNQLKVLGWIDDNIDERGPLAAQRGSAQDTGTAVLAALARAGFLPPISKSISDRTATHLQPPQGGV